MPRTRAAGRRPTLGRWRPGRSASRRLAAALIGRIHDTPTLAVVAVTGGGAAALSDLLNVPGASRTVLELRVPYAAEALADLLGAEPAQAVSTATAAAMAVACRDRALALSSGGGAARRGRLHRGAGVGPAQARSAPGARRRCTTAALPACGRWSCPRAHAPARGRTAWSAMSCSGPWRRRAACRRPGPRSARGDHLDEELTPRAPRDGDVGEPWDIGAGYERTAPRRGGGSTARAGGRRSADRRAGTSRWPAPPR